MKFADANVFLRYMVRSVTPIDQARALACAALFARVRAGDEAITTSEAVVAEVFFVMTSRRQYGLSVADAVSLLDPILAMRGLKLPRKRMYRRALTILVTYPRLDFEDALTIAMLERSKIPLLSYDSDFDRVAGITRQEP
jgi:predicted nucleic acid-binding protein